MDKHTICLMNDAFPPQIDGVANVITNYAKIIESTHGHAVVATPEYPGADDSVWKFPVVRYPSLDTRKMTSGYVAGIPFSPELAEKLGQEKVELLHCHCPMVSAYLARELREKVKAPLVMTYHTKYDIDIAKVIRSKLLQESSIRAIVRNISAFDEVWVVSEGAGENLRSLGYQGDYVVMQNGVDLAKGRATDGKVAEVTVGYDLPEDVPVFVFVGRLMWYKGVRIILDALKIMREAGMDFRMMIIGGGADGDEMKAYTEQLGLTDRVFFTGPVADREEIRAWYTRGDLFLFPSTFDTNGLVVREAAACGLGSVLIAGSCASEGVTDGRNAFLIEENASAMAALLLKVGRDRDAMRQLGEHASEDLYMSWDDAVAAAYERYGIVIDNYRSGRYPEHEKIGDDFLEAQGSLMEAIVRLENARDRGEARRQQISEDVERRMDEFTDKIETRVDTFTDRIESRAHRFTGRVEEHVDEVWQKLDRYL